MCSHKIQKYKFGHYIKKTKYDCSVKDSVMVNITPFVNIYLQL